MNIGEDSGNNIFVWQYQSFWILDLLSNTLLFQFLDLKLYI